MQRLPGYHWALKGNQPHPLLPGRKRQRHLMSVFVLGCYQNDPAIEQQSAAGLSNKILTPLRGWGLGPLLPSDRTHLYVCVSSDCVDARKEQFKR